MQALQRAPSELIIVSPFISRIPGFKPISNFARFVLSRNNSRLIIVTRPPVSGSETLTLEEASILENMGVDLYIRPKPVLHSKVYMFRFSDGSFRAFIGSANFTLGGFDRNEETIAFFHDPIYKKEIDREISRLTDIGTLPLRLWKMTVQRKVKRI